MQKKGLLFIIHVIFITPFLSVILMHILYSIFPFLLVFCLCLMMVKMIDRNVFGGME